MAKIQLLYCPHTKRETFKGEKNSAASVSQKAEMITKNNTHQSCVQKIYIKEKDLKEKINNLINFLFPL